MSVADPQGNRVLWLALIGVANMEVMTEIGNLISEALAQESSGSLAHTGVVLWQETCSEYRT